MLPVLHHGAAVTMSSRAIAELRQAAKSLFSYNQETGVFTRLVRVGNQPSGRVIAGADRCGYLRVTINYKSYFAHHIAWLLVHGELPTEIDHRDGDPANNAIANLRLATRSQNQANRGIQSNNVSGVKGVCWDRRRNRWKVFVGDKRRQIFIGRFKTFEDAVQARLSAALDIHGEFAHELVVASHKPQGA